MAEALASAAVSNLSDLILSFISGQYEIVTNVKSKLERLDSNLKLIKSVIGAVGRKEVTEIDPNVVSWLNELKDAVYDAEDILDVFNYKSLEASGNVAKRAWIDAKRAFFPDGSFHDLSDIVNKFDSLLIDGRIQTFIGVIQMNTETKKEGELSDWRQTSPVLGEARVWGRSKEMDDLLDKVLVSSDEKGSNGDNFSVVSIVGMGGVGKTILAQWLYNHEDVNNHFNLKAWVCVSDKSITETVMMKIIESATGQHHNHNHINFANIHEDLLRLLSKKRFLIVLDDVWAQIVTQSQWDKFKSVFRHGEKGSKIVISTRDRIIAGKVSSMHTINLEGLRGEEYWKFFRSCAFGNVNPKDHPKLEHIGKQIASKLGGLPLAAKTVGGVLKSSLEETDWTDVLENKEWQREGSTILPSLRLSYNHLPAHLKQCFAYCALFPRDYVFNFRILVHIWVAQGYVQSRHGTKTLEDVGQEYFNELYSRSFFQEYDRPKDKYVIHDLLHDLAESILADEVYRVENSSSLENDIPKRVRHLFVSSSDLDIVLNQIKEPNSKLRSLVYDPPYTSSSSKTLCPDFKKLEKLRVLVLGEHYSLLYLPKTIGNMIHLRYLEFSITTMLPISLGRLFNLQVLQLLDTRDFNKHLNSYDPNRWFLLYTYTPMFEDDMFHSSNDQTRKFHKKIGKLTNLRYIYAPPSFMSAIPSIGKLTSLLTLPYYEVRKQEGYKICELRTLNKIKGCLYIANLENVAMKEEAKKAELHNKVNLEALCLLWKKSDDCSNDEFRLQEEVLEGLQLHSNTKGIGSNDEFRLQEEVLEGLQPHSNIKGIGIFGYMGLKHPIWFNKSYLPNIESIALYECCHLKALPSLWEFPFLKFLSLDHLTSLEMIGLEAHGRGDKVFPSLQHLKMFSLDELREWPSFKENVRDMMPRLSTLEIIKCNKLEALPPLGELPSLEYLDLVGLDSLEKIGAEIYGQGSIAFPKLKHLKVSDMSGLTEWCALEQGWPRFKENVRDLMPRISRLEITNCNKLKALPLLEELPSLKYLKLKGLHSLEKISVEIYGQERIALLALKDLTLSDMSGLKEWRALEQGQVLMPCLETLRISDCRKLKGAIHCSSTLEKLEFGLSVDATQMFHELFPASSLTCLKTLRLEALKGLESFTDAQQEWFQSLTSLRKLVFADCSELRRLPDDLGSLYCLESLQLIYCRAMVSLEQKSLPKNLKEFTVKGCGELGKQCNWRKKGTEWNKISHIPLIRIENETVIPPLVG